MENLGTVISFNPQSYFGFIEMKGLCDVFFHGKHVLLPPGQVVCVGDVVEFDIEPDDRRPGRTRAVNVRVLSRADPPMQVEVPERRRRYDTRHMVAKGPGAIRVWRADW